MVTQVAVFSATPGQDPLELYLNQATSQRTKPRYQCHNLPPSDLEHIPFTLGSENLR